MPQIIVTASAGNEQVDGPVLMRERVNIADFESDQFAAQLVERVGWALSDADDMEQDEVAAPSKEFGVPGVVLRS